MRAGRALQRPTTQPFYHYNCENLQAIRRGPWKLHLPRSQDQLPFWEKNKAFANLKTPVRYNLDSDKTESTNVASHNPEIVRELMGHSKSARENFGEFMQRGKFQRPTGTLFPDIPVISHEKDWNTLDPEIVEAISMERLKRHPSHGSNNSGQRKKQQK